MYRMGYKNLYALSQSTRLTDGRTDRRVSRD